jgi:hypothetical protein
VECVRAASVDSRTNPVLFGAFARARAELAVGLTAQEFGTQAAELCLDFSRCRRSRLVATTDRLCWPNEVDASAYSGAVSKNSVVRQSAQTTGLHELRTGPGFDDPLACCVGTVGVVWIVDEQQRWIVGAGRNSADVGVKQRQSEAPVKTLAQTFAYAGSEAMTVAKKVQIQRKVTHGRQEHQVPNRGTRSRRERNGFGAKRMRHYGAGGPVGRDDGCDRFGALDDCGATGCEFARVGLVVAG